MDTATVEDSLRLGGGLGAADRGRVTAQLAKLDPRLRSFAAGTVDLELSVKERDMPTQQTTLEASIAGWSRLVATSSLVSLDQAVAEVRDDLIRQITDAKNRTEPRNNRQRRDTTL